MCAWQQPETTRRYLHPPKSERIITMWREGKLMLGGVELAPGPTVPKYTDLICCGIWPVYGKKIKRARQSLAKILITSYLLLLTFQKIMNAI